MHLLLLTTNNLATNPRLVKELTTAVSMRLNATVVQYKLGNWSDNKSEQLKEVVSGEKTVVSEELREANAKKREVEFIEIDATSKRKISWLKWGILEKLAQRVYPLFQNNLFINALASSRRSLQLVNVLKETEKPDLIVAHNLGALYPAYVLSKKWRIPFIFDVEDYHPGEYIRHDAQNEKARREFLMKTLLPKAAAITSASPLIGQYTMNLIGGHPNHTVILNSFPQHEFTLPTHIPLCGTPLRFDSQLKLVWFSQKISFGRGLEQLFEALVTLTHEQNLQEPSLRHEPLTSNFELPTSNIEPIPFHGTPLRCETSNQNPIPYILYPKPYSLNPIPYILNPNPFPLKPKTYPLNLTLIGHLDPEFEKTILYKYSSLLTTHYSLLIKPPLSQSALHAELANHDIGLALEFSDTDLNRQLCLTNKILAYGQAGLYILATDTPAQSAFMVQQPQRGVVCGQTPEAMAAALSQIIENSHEIKQQAPERFEKGKELAWEMERGKLEAIWELQRVIAKSAKVVSRKGSEELNI